VALAVLVVLVAAVLAGRGGSGGGGGGPDADAAAPAGDEAQPFGLDQIAGLEPIGRPSDHLDTRLPSDDGTSVTGTWWAAYRVTADDPPAVVRDVLAGAEGLTLDVGEVGAGSDDAGFWMVAYAEETADDLMSGDRLGLQLWATDDGPILLVEVSEDSEEHAHRHPEVADAEVPEEPPTVVDHDERSAGDTLFTEQGTDIHLPDGTSTLMATLPTQAGTGGSTTLLAAEDGEAAVQAMMDEAMASSEYGDLTEPERATTPGGHEVVRASFGIAAGGWAFDALSIRGPDDPYATVYVTSSAD
jgi:hypothetical protein